jgi:hypothetical protein
MKKILTLLLTGIILFSACGQTLIPEVPEIADEPVITTTASFTATETPLITTLPPFTTMPPVTISLPTVTLPEAPAVSPADIPLVYDIVRAFSGGLAAVGNGFGEGETLKWGFIDRAGNEVIPLQYDYVEDFSDGLALVVNYPVENNWSVREQFFIDKTGEVVIEIPSRYNQVFSFFGGVAQFGVGNPGGYGFIDRTGREIIQPRFGYTNPSHNMPYFHEDLLAATTRNGSSAGFIDISGNIIILFTFEYTRSFSEGMAAVAIWETIEVYECGSRSVIDKWGFINKSGDIIIPTIYDTVSPFKEGLAFVNINDDWGYLNKNGDVIIEFGRYENITFGGMGLWGISDFDNGLAAVSLNGKIGFIDTTGNEVIPFKYDFIHGFFGNDYTIVNTGAEHARTSGGTEPLRGNWYIIDRQGNETPINYDYVRRFSEGFAAVNIGIDRMNNEVASFLGGGKWGLIDTNGNEVIPLEYDRVETFSEGMAAVMRDGKWGFISIG